MTWTDAGIFFIYNIYINIYNIYINISLNQFVLKRLKDMVHRNLDRSRGNAVFGECHGVRRKFRQRYNYCTVRSCRNRRAVSGWASEVRRAGADAGAASWLHSRGALRCTGCDVMRCAARGAIQCAARGPMRCELVAIRCAALRCAARCADCLRCNARGLVAFARCRRRHTFGHGWV
jgi:hypothetical protein